MKKIESLENRGGKREGAGRKKRPELIRKKAITVQISPWIILWLRSNPKSQASLIEDALIAHNGLINPN